MVERILILGGTKEAVALAAELVEAGNTVITSLAGRTREPVPSAGETRVGGFGGVSGLVLYLRDHSIDHMIDATHPFATQISANAQEAARETGIAFEARTRAPWPQHEGDDWWIVPDLQTAVEALPARARALLALGRQHIAPFSKRQDVHFLIRMIEAPDTELPFSDHTLLLARPSSNAEDEAQLLRDHRITHIVSRNSGGAGAYAKIEAARQLSLPVIMIERPT